MMSLFSFRVKVVLAALLLTACAAEPEVVEPEEAAEPEVVEPEEPAEEPAVEEPVAFPERPITIVVPWGVGGLTDSSVRALQQPLQEALDERIIIENLPGGVGLVGAHDVYGSEPDGYRLLTVVNPTAVMSEMFGEDPVPFLEFEYLGRIALDVQSIVVRADSPFETFDDLAAAAAEERLTLAQISGPIGNLYTGVFEEAAGASVVAVPYDSGFEIARAVIDGVVDFGNVAFSVAQGPVEDGELRILAHHGSDVIPGFEDIEVLGQRVPGSGFFIEVGFVAPPGTPADVVEFLRDAIAEAATGELFAQTVPEGMIPSHLNGDSWREVSQAFYALAEEMRPIIEGG